MELPALRVFHHQSAGRSTKQMTECRGVHRREGVGAFGNGDRTLRKVVPSVIQQAQAQVPGFPRLAAITGVNNCWGGGYFINNAGTFSNHLLCSSSPYRRCIALQHHFLKTAMHRTSDNHKSVKWWGEGCGRHPFIIQVLGANEDEHKIFFANTQIRWKADSALLVK